MTVADAGIPAAACCPSEMEIVDTFTRLIFGDAESLSAMEQMIVDTLRLVDANVALDTTREMGVYLRSLGVAEMISLVSRVRRDFPSPAQTQSPASGNPRARL